MQLRNARKIRRLGLRLRLLRRPTLLPTKIRNPVPTGVFTTPVKLRPTIDLRPRRRHTTSPATVPAIANSKTPSHPANVSSKSASAAQAPAGTYTLQVAALRKEADAHAVADQLAEEEISRVRCFADLRQVFPRAGRSLFRSQVRGSREERPRERRFQGHREALMPQRAWASFFRPQPGSATPDAFRYVFAALSGAALSFSYTGFYLSIYSWVCVGILLIVLFGARPRVAFCLRLSSFDVFRDHLLSVDRHGTRRPRRPLQGRRLGRAAFDRMSSSES